MNATVLNKNLTTNYTSLPRMDIYAPHGTKVIFDEPNNGRPFHQDTAKKHLIVGKVYTVDFTEVFNSSTDVYLVGLPNVGFNSVLFGEIN